MGDAAALKTMSASDDLAWERTQLDRHEFHLGEVFAMAGASLRHDYRGPLAGRRREGVPRVYVRSAKLEPGTTDVVASPRVVVEVLSPSTEAYDRGQQWEAYQQLPSLTDYLLVSASAARVEHFRRQPDGSWRYSVLGPGATLTLADGGAVSIDVVYAGAFELEAS